MNLFTSPNNNVIIEFSDQQFIVILFEKPLHCLIFFETMTDFLYWQVT